MHEPVWKSVARGRCFVYLLPCRDEDTQKIGFARDPWLRMHAFHPRFYAFFDLDRGALIETDRVSEARSIETRLKVMFAMSKCVAPLMTRQRAGGKNEWFRGIDGAAMAALQGISESLGYPLHAPLAPWLRERWMQQAAVIRDWSRQQFEWLEALHFNADPSLGEPCAQRLHSALSAWDAIGLPLHEILDERVSVWLRNGFED